MAAGLFSLSHHPQGVQTMAVMRKRETGGDEEEEGVQMT